MSSVMPSRTAVQACRRPAKIGFDSVIQPGTSQGTGAPCYSPRYLLHRKAGCQEHIINCNEVIWSSSGIALGLVVKPIFQYNPKTNGVAWTKREDDFLVGKQLAVCYHSGGKVQYLGTYERVESQGTMVMAADTLKNLDNTVRAMCIEMGY